MAPARFTPTAGSGPRSLRRRIIAATWCSTLVATTSLTAVLVSRPAAADQVADLKAQATKVAQQLIEDQLQVGAYQQQYSVETQKVDADAVAIAAIGRQITQDELQIKTETLDVRRQAITSYMAAGGNLSNSEAVLFTGDAEKAQLATEYAMVASGNIEASLDGLRAAQRTFQAGEAVLAQQQARDQSNQALQAGYLVRADTTANQMASVQAQVTGQLAAAVAAQSAAQAAAAAAAVRAAQKAAKPAPSGSPSSAPSGSLTDPALNPFLQCVVQVESGGDYQAVSPDGEYMGAFQFSQATWNTAAQDAGLPDLVGVAPNDASKAAQDTVAVALYALDGNRPWLGDRCGS